MLNFALTILVCRQLPPFVPNSLVNKQPPDFCGAVTNYFMLVKVSINVSIAATTLTAASGGHFPVGNSHSWSLLIQLHVSL